MKESIRSLGGRVVKAAIEYGTGDEMQKWSAVMEFDKNGMLLECITNTGNKMINKLRQWNEATRIRTEKSKVYLCDCTNEMIIYGSHGWHKICILKVKMEGKNNG